MPSTAWWTPSPLRRQSQRIFQVFMRANADHDAGPLGVGDVPSAAQLEIVTAVAQGFEVQREPVGKRIIARIALLDDPGGAVAGRSPL